MNKSVIAVILVIFFLAFAASVSAQPQLTIPETEFNFGYVPQHSQISHVFWLHSTGTDTLKIISVKPG